MKQQRPKPTKPICPYCGVREGTTKDHVISKCLFLSMPVKDTFTVKVCRECNEEKSKCEDYLAEVLQSHFIANQHPVATSLTGKVFRSIDKGNSKLAKEMIEQYGPLLREYPHILDKIKHFPLTTNAERLERALQFIVRGLYAHYQKPLYLPQNCFIGVRRVGEDEMMEKLPRLCYVTPIGPHIIGDMVAIVRYYVSPEMPVESLWLITFYQSVVFTVLTSEADPSNPTQTRTA
jgi:hypothetical protein